MNGSYILSLYFAPLLTFRRYRKDMAQLGIFLRLTGKKVFSNWAIFKGHFEDVQAREWTNLHFVSKRSVLGDKKSFFVMFPITENWDSTHSPF